MAEGHRSWLRVLRVAGGALFLVAATACSPWAQNLANPGHTSVNEAERSLSRSSVTGLKLAWSSPTPTSSPPAVAGGVLYVGTGDSLQALDARSGSPRWTAPGAARFPAVVGDVVVACVAAVGLVGFDAATGADRWSRPANCSGTGPTVAGDTVYATTDPDNITAFRAATGAVRWDAAPCAPGLHPQWTPTIADGVAYVTCQGLTGSTEQGLSAVDAATGAPRWDVTVATTLIDSPPAVRNNRLYVGTGGVGYGDLPPGKVLCLDASSGAAIWTATIPSFVGFQAPAVTQHRVYVLASDGFLRALNTRTGSIQWAKSIGIPGGPPALANGVVYAATNDGGVTAIDLGAPHRVLFRADVVAEILGAGPVVADGTLYVAAGASGVLAFRP